MQYNYKFEKEKCWYSQVCSKYNTMDCNGGCVRYIKFHYLVTNSLLPEKQQRPKKLMVPKKDIVAYKELNNIKNNIVDFVKNGENLCICSNFTGNGKTTWAVKLLLRYFNEIWADDSFNVRGLFIKTAKLCIAEKEKISANSEYIEHIKNNIEKADLVVWDDIGIKSLTDFEHDYLYSYINDRVFNGKSNIFTTNGTLDTLPDILGPRLYSRVCKDCTVIEFKTGDSRKE